MKIIVNQPRASYFVGGAEMISFDHAINFHKLGNEVYFFTIKPSSVGLKYSNQFSMFKKNYSNVIKIIELEQSPMAKDIYEIEPGEDRRRWNVESIFYNQVLYDFLKKGKRKYDLLFSYYNLDAVFFPRKLIGSNTLYLCGIPREQNDFQGSFLYSYDNVLAISDEVKKSWEKYAKNGIEVVSTGVNCERFGLKNSSSKKIRLLYIGRIIERKNVSMIVEAYMKLREKYDIDLTIVGDGPDLENVKTISKDVVYTGAVSNPEDYYKNADIFITPSKYGEGLQGSILEAMSCGLTVVATNTDINRELLDDGRGFLVKPILQSVVDGIEIAIKADRNKIEIESRKYVVKHFNWIEKCKDILGSIK